MTAVPKRKLTVQEYLELEAKSDVKHEFLNGEMFAMAGASRQHNDIGANITVRLGMQLLDGSCKLYGSDQRVQVEDTGLYTYPDVTVVCGPREYSGVDPNALVNPRVIFEVLSPSTERHDRTTKVRHYSRIPTLQEYVLVSQTQPEILHLFRNGDTWSFDVLFELDDVLEFKSIAARLKLSDIYRDVPFPELDPPQ